MHSPVSVKWNMKVKGCKNALCDLSIKIVLTDN